MVCRVSAASMRPWSGPQKVEMLCALCAVGIQAVFEELMHLDSSYYGAISHHYVILILRGD